MDDLAALSAEAAKFATPAAAATTLGIWWTAKVKWMHAAREEAERARQEHDQRVSLAQATERSRIAQELHDVAGQHLAGLTTLADAAMKLAPAQPEHAFELVADVRDESRFPAAILAGAHADLRATAPDAATSVPDLRRVPELVGYWRGRGMALTFVGPVGVLDLPAVVSTTAYRCLQEALTSVAKHSPGVEAEINAAVCLDRLAVNLDNLPDCGPVQPRGRRWISTPRPSLPPNHSIG